LLKKQNTSQHPFDIQLTKKGRFRFSKGLKEAMRANMESKKANEAAEAAALAAASELEEQSKHRSTADKSEMDKSMPDSLRSTPRENPLKILPKMDLTLDTQIKRADLKETLIQLLTDLQSARTRDTDEGDILEDDFDEEELFPNKHELFPRFGESPTRTLVNVTPPILSPHQIPEPPKIETPRKVSYSHMIFFFVFLIILRKY
jgi:hypothetical protein